MFGKQKSLISEMVSDTEVIQSLLRTISKLTGGIVMSILIQDQDGRLIMANRFEEVDLEEAKNIKAKLENDLATLNAYINKQETPESAAADPAPVAAEQPAPAQEDPNAQTADQPATPAPQPDAPADQTTAAPADQSAPADGQAAAAPGNADQPAAADTPAADPALAADAPLNMQ